MHHLPDAPRTRQLTTDELRDAFLVRDLFVPGRLTLHHIDLDRLVLGGAVPTTAPLRLEAPAWLGAEFLTERRELGVLNIGGAGQVTVDGTAHTLAPRDVLYVSMGSREVVLASDTAGTPAKFYLLSYPAHASHPTTVVRRADAAPTDAGSSAQANKRQICKYIHAGGAQSAQLVMGVTDLAPGNVWNTMPAHTHERRTEVYLYFDLPADGFVLHLMGEPHETRHLVVREGEAVLSPGWSIHAGCGTGAYSFCWAMGGENKDYADMQPVAMGELK